MQSRTIPQNYYIRKLKLPQIALFDVLTILATGLYGILAWALLRGFVYAHTGAGSPMDNPLFVLLCFTTMIIVLLYPILLAVQCGRLCKESRGFTVGLILTIAAAAELFPLLAVAYYLIYHRRHIVRLRRHLRLRFAEESDRYRL